MGQGTGEIRQGIEETRARVGDEVEALSYKTDVGARLDDYVDDKKEAVVSRVRSATGTVTSAASAVVPSNRRLRSMRDSAERNPLGLVVGGTAVGFLVGLLVPSTRVEDEHIGEMASELKDTAVSEAGHVADTAKGEAKAVAQEVKYQAKDLYAQTQRELSALPRNSNATPRRINPSSITRTGI